MLKLSRFEGSIPLSPLLESMEPVLEPAGYVAPLFFPLPPPPPAAAAAWILILYLKAISFPNGILKVLLF